MHRCSDQQQPPRDVQEILTDDMDSLITLTDTHSTNPAMARHIDHVLSLSKSTPAKAVSTGATATKAQFRPTAMQRHINHQLVSGTHGRMGPPTVDRHTTTPGCHMRPQTLALK
ncbi:hypothetical protein ON010_g1783 [Phytophthora cinnamomi]|nr:hypothetical protein ON010_g1783 [Phytophthora cinnamomi]